MSDILYSDMTYCTLCDRYFPGDEARAVHVQLSSNHPKCEACDRRFANKNSLRNHWVCSPRHHYCTVCDRDFKTAGGLRVHIDYAAVHRDDSDDDDSENEDEIDDSAEGWEDELGRQMYPEGYEQAAAEAEGGDASDNVDYWTQDEAEDFEEDRDAYYGFAPTPGLVSDAALNGNAEDTSRKRFEEWEKAKSDGGKCSQKTPASSIQFSCPLCLEAPKDTSATKCGHLFCTPCIKTALATKKMCPVCRDFTIPKQLRKIYLGTA